MTHRSEHFHFLRTGWRHGGLLVENGFKVFHVLFIALDQIFVLFLLKNLGEGFLVFVIVLPVGFPFGYGGQENLGVGIESAGSAKIEIDIENHVRQGVLGPVTDVLRFQNRIKALALKVQQKRFIVKIARRKHNLDCL